ncbi:MAG: hypothetical protein WC821_02635 [archaeon]|jgi:hypothetical protein
MPIKQTKPRTGSKPMTYFKGTQQELKKITAAQALETFSKSEIKFYGREHATKETEIFRTNISSLAKKLDKGQTALTTLITEHGVIVMRVQKTKSGKILLHQQPQTHGLMSTGGARDRYEILERILKKGFIGKSAPNTVIRKQRTRVGWIAAQDARKNPITKGDGYSVEFMTPVGNSAKKHTSGSRETVDAGTYFARRSNPNQILSVNITTDPLISKEVMKQKIDFYKEHIQRKYGVPVKFLE